MESTNEMDLEENFKLFYRMAKVYILELNNEDRTLAAQWLRKLAACTSPEDSQLRNHYMTLLLITLQQKKIVGPFKKTPSTGQKLEPFSTELQVDDIRKLLDEEISKVPPTPLAQFGLTGGKLSTEYSVTQEVPKFGVHFYYVYTLEPIYDFQRANQSRIPPAMRGPSESTMRDLNAGVEHLLKSEKKKLKVTVDQLGRKQIQIRDEHFAEFSGPSRPRQIPKRLQKRFGFKAPSVEQSMGTPITDFVQQSPPPRGTPPDSTSGRTVEETVAAALGAAVAAAADSHHRTGAVPKPRTIPRPSSRTTPKYTGAIPKPSRSAPPPRVPLIKIQPPTPERAPPTPPRRSPRFTPHPFAPPTPPLFSVGGSTQGLSYEPEYFGLDPKTKFNYPREKITTSKWTPSKRGERVQIRDIIGQHPISEQTRQLSPDQRRRLLTPEIQQEVDETLRRSNLLFQTEDNRTRELMRRYYSSKPIRPKVLDFTPEDEVSSIVTEQHEPISMPLNSTPVVEQHQERFYTPPSVPRAATPRTVTPRIPTPRQTTPHRDISYETPPRALRPTVQPIYTRPDWFVEEEDLLEEGDIQLDDELIHIPSPIRATSSRFAPSEWPEAEGDLLDEEEIAFAEDLPSPQWRSPSKSPTRSRDQTSAFQYSPEISPGGTTARLIDAGDDIPPMSPKSPRAVASMMDDIILSTPDRMSKLAHIMSQIGQQVTAHQELIQDIEQIARTPSIENLKSECVKGAETLRAIHSKLKTIKESAKSKMPSPKAVTEPEVPPEEPVPFSPIRLTLQFQDLSDAIDATMDSAQVIQQVAQSVQEQVVQEAANKSDESVNALQEISDRVKDVAKTWEKRIMDLDTSSLGLLEDEELNEDLLSSPMQENMNRMIDVLDQSVKDVIAEGGDPRSEAAQNLQVTLHNFKEAVHNLSAEFPSLLDQSFPAESLLEETISDLQSSIQSEVDALSAISRTPDRENVLNRAEAVVEAMNEVLDEVQAIEEAPIEKPPSPRQQMAARLQKIRTAHRHVPEDVLVMVDDFDPNSVVYEPLTLDLPESGDEEPSGKERVQTLPATSGPQLERVAEVMQQEMLGLLERAHQQQEALLQASFEIQENAHDASAVAASQQAAQKIHQAQQIVTDMMARVEGSPMREDERDFRWLGPMAPKSDVKSSASARRPRSAPHGSSVRKPAVRTPSVKSVASRTAMTKPASARPPSAIRRPVRGASPQPLALPDGVQAPRPRAGSATPVPVRRPPRPVPLAGSTPLPQASVRSSSIRTMIPRPGSSAAER